MNALEEGEMKRRLTLLEPLEDEEEEEDEEEAEGGLTNTKVSLLLLQHSPTSIRQPALGYWLFHQQCLIIATD